MTASSVFSLHGGVLILELNVSGLAKVRSSVNPFGIGNWEIDSLSFAEVRQ